MSWRDIADSRTGDKGNTSNISVIAYDAKHLSVAARASHQRAGQAHFAGVVEGDVVRDELPEYFGAEFLAMAGALGGGVRARWRSTRTANR